jgi:hypothetical protein
MIVPGLTATVAKADEAENARNVAEKAYKAAIATIRSEKDFHGQFVGIVTGRVHDASHLGRHTCMLLVLEANPERPDGLFATLHVV